MKFKITTDQYNNLPEGFKSEYRKEGEDYLLSIEGGEDTGALKRAKDHEKTARQKAEKEVLDLKSLLDSRETELNDIRKGVIPKDDVTALENSWKNKLDIQKKEFEDKITTSQTALNRLLVDNVANDIANKISTVPNLIKPQIAARLQTEIIDGTPKTRVLDAEGKPSALNLEDLKTEFENRADLAPVIIGSQASGGGSSGQGDNKGSANKSFAELTGSERVALFEHNKAEYDRLKKESLIKK